MDRKKHHDLKQNILKKHADIKLTNQEWLDSNYLQPVADTLS